jgi:hypothetical protein
MINDDNYVDSVTHEVEWNAYCRDVEKEALDAWEWDAYFREQAEEALDAWCMTPEEARDTWGDAYCDDEWNSV